MTNLNLELLEEENSFDEDIEIESEEEIVEPFDPTSIRVDSRPMIIDLVLKRIRYDEIDMAPDFQRHADIWTDKAKSKLIESILLRIPIPAFYMDATNEDKWLVIDGLQRLSTLKKFVIDKELKLTGLEYLTDLKDKNYDDLPRNYQRRIDETLLTIFVIEKGTAPEIKYNLFRRINTGGISLSPQELRHAINPGKATSFLRKLAKIPEFKKVTNLSKKRTQRMDDLEFILGFLAFTFTESKNYPINKGRDYFLNEAMKKINNTTQTQEKELEEKFKYAMNCAWGIFGNNAFRKIVKNQKKKYPVNKALFETWSVALSNLSLQQVQILITRKERLKEKFIDRIENDLEFIASISQAANKVNYRFTKIEALIEEVLL